MDTLKLVVDHPDFAGVYARGVNGLPVVIFNRKLKEELAQEQIDDYYRREAIVTENGGYMKARLYDLQKDAPAFTRDICCSCIRAIRHSLPDWRVVYWWNGPESHSFSVSITRKTDTFTRYGGRDRSQDKYRKHYQKRARHE